MHATQKGGFEECTISVLKLALIHKRGTAFEEKVKRESPAPAKPKLLIWQ